MPIKYTREGHGLEPGRRETKWPVPRLRQRLIVIYAGLSFMSLLLIGYFIAFDPDAETTTMEARATVVEKREHPGSESGGAFELILEVQLPDRERVTTSLFTDAPSWNAVNEGDQVLVHYKRPFLSKSVRVYRMQSIEDPATSPSVP